MVHSLSLKCCLLLLGHVVTYVTANFALFGLRSSSYSTGSQVVLLNNTGTTSSFISFYLGNSTFRFATDGVYVMEFLLSSAYSVNNGNLCQVSPQYLTGASTWTSYHYGLQNPYGGWLTCSQYLSKFMISTSAVSSKIWRISINCNNAASVWLTSVQWSRLAAFRVDLQGAPYGLYYQSLGSAYGTGAQQLQWTSQFSSGITLNGDYSWTFSTDGVFVFQMYLNSQFSYTGGVSYVICYIFSSIITFFAFLQLPALPIYSILRRPRGQPMNLAPSSLLMRTTPTHHFTSTS